MHLWDRVRDWDLRISRRLGLRFDDPARSPEENIRRAQMALRNRGDRPPVVEEADFVSAAEAKAAIGGWVAGARYNLLVSNRILRSCFLADGTQGVTKESLLTEVSWRRTRTFADRAARAVRIIANGI